jgi:hypothetical protein
MARSVIALGNEDVVVDTALERLMQRDWRSHEHLLDLAEALEPGLQFEMVVGARLGDGRDDGNIVAFGANVVSGRDDRDIDIWRESSARELSQFFLHDEFVIYHFYG